MSRTVVFAALRRALRLAQCANHSSKAPEELIEHARYAPLTRRQFLHATAATAGLAAAGTVIPGCRTLRPARRAHDARVAIVGGGLAGLNAACTLRKAGVPTTVYEAGERVGGRVFSARHALAPDLVTELGAEFIDTGHAEMHALVREFGLELMDVQAPGERELNADVFFFDGRRHAMHEIVAGFRPLAARLAADQQQLGDAIDYRHPTGDAGLDSLSLAAYLDRIDARGVVRELLEVAYVSEYGLDVSEQSALNLVRLIGTESDADELALYGESDERFKIRGGNQQLTDALAARLDGALRLGHRLESLRSQGSGFRLTFAKSGGSLAEATADIVLLALPFTLLRAVDLSVDLPPVKRRAIAELGYGSNTKVFAGFQQRVWRQRGDAGNVYSDLPFQTAWDNSRLQAGDAGGLTFYLGGQAGVRAGDGNAADQVARFLADVEAVFPGAAAVHNGCTARFHWPSSPLARGSYSCYRPGQWTSIAGAEGELVGNLYFAGEHCSRDYQGFMNGAAETGRVAAEAILARIGVR